jgi:hypothetical protein
LETGLSIGNQDVFHRRRRIGLFETPAHCSVHLDTKVTYEGIHCSTKQQITAGSKTKSEQLAGMADAILPTALADSAEEAILDTSGDLHALLWHRSELENILQKNPSTLAPVQKRRLAALDTQIRRSALLIAGSEKGHLRSYRKGRYDRSHWWWYLDDILQEEAIAKSQKTLRSAYNISTQGKRLRKVADRRAVYKRKRKSAKRMRD